MTVTSGTQVQVDNGDTWIGIHVKLVACRPLLLVPGTTGTGGQVGHTALLEVFFFFPANCGLIENGPSGNGDTGRPTHC